MDAYAATWLSAEFRPTSGPGEAETLAFRAAQQGFPIVAAAGGDGTVHEVANGVILSEKSDIIFAPLPAGSANDYVHSLGLSDDWWRRPDPDVGPGLVDVGLVRSGKRSRYFVNGFGAGFNALVTREAGRIRRLRGLPLYGLAVLRVIFLHYTAPVTTVRFDDGEARTAPMLGLSLALGRREGNFVVAPNASLDDGLFDYVHGGQLTRRGILVFMAQMAAQRLPTDHPFVRTGRCGMGDVALQNAVDRPPGRRVFLPTRRRSARPGSAVAARACGSSGNLAPAESSIEYPSA